MLKRGIGVAALVVLLDQLTKAWVVGFFAGQPRMVGVTPFFSLVLTWNRGVSFGFFNAGDGPGPLVFSLLAAAIVIALLLWLARTDDPLLAGGIGLVIGGAIGNVVDRLSRGAVVDFLDFHLAGWHWPAFNVADAGICIGVGLMLLDGLLGRREARS
jgi:signal peptidase II